MCLPLQSFHAPSSCKWKESRAGMVSGTQEFACPVALKNLQLPGKQLPSLQQIQNETNRAHACCIRQGTGKSAPQQAGERPALAELDTAEAATHSCLCTL